MRTDEIRKMIEKGVSDEEQTGRLATAIGQLARQNGMNPSKQEIQGAVSFAREYVEHVPYYLEQGDSAAKQLGLAAEMGQMLRELEAYWFEANDIIPDHLGLMGLTDDAYASQILARDARSRLVAGWAPFRPGQADPPAAPSSSAGPISPIPSRYP